MAIARVEKCLKNCDYCSCKQEVPDEIVAKYGYDLTEVEISKLDQEIYNFKLAKNC